MDQILNKAAASIAELPGIGYKSAIRIAFYLLKKEEHEFQSFIHSLIHFRENTDFCSTCGALIDIHEKCDYCENPNRDKNRICVVEQPSDIFIIERTGDYNGHYHVLMGVLSPLDGVGPDDIHLSDLMRRAQKNLELEEIIIATNPSIEGNATANYIHEMLRELNNFNKIKITRIASGLAAGSQLDYADSGIVSQAFRSRIEMESFD